MEKISKLCKCGCNRNIIIQKHHSRYGIPNYIHGHNASGVKHLIESVRKRSQSLKEGYASGRIEKLFGDKNPARQLNVGQKISLKKLGHPCYKIGKVRYKDILFRSSWEATFAKFLDKHKLTWQYEPKRFTFKCMNKTYCPDFFVNEFNSYIEIKGRYREDCIKKIESFYQEYPDLNLIVIDDARQIKNMKVANEL